MSATNLTATIELSQYISTDKPTYLVDYNGDMLKIDNAIAADRGSIADVNTVAERADGKADTNKTSIDTLNVQINGDPQLPSDTGMAGKVSTLEGNVNTINSLIGNGSPTTSDQTIIGAVNGLEGSLAPREDGANLANSYAIGAQFARGGSVYTALNSLTENTPFASLTLNTDYKVSDTLVEQIEDVKGDIPDFTGDYILTTYRGSVSVTADGVKTVSELLDELYDKIGTDVKPDLTARDRLLYKTLIIEDYLSNSIPQNYGHVTNSSTSWSNTFILISVTASETTVKFGRLVPSSSTMMTVVNGTITNNSSEVPTSGKTVTLYYEIITQQ